MLEGGQCIEKRKDLPTEYKHIRLKLLNFFKNISKFKEYLNHFFTGIRIWWQPNRSTTSLLSWIIQRWRNFIHISMFVKKIKETKSKLIIVQLDMQPTALRRIRPYYAPSYATYPPSIMNAVRTKEKYGERYSIIMRVTVKAIELVGNFSIFG